jgi:lipid-binding SYLF domain-containing protein
MMRTLFLVTALLAYAATAKADLPSPTQTLEHSTDVLADLEKIPLKGIPPKLLEDAKAVAIIPGVVKAGLIVGGRGGHGLVLIRNEKGEWSEPTFVSIGGASIGFQAGVQSTDVVLVFKKKDTLKKVLDGKGKLTLGADAAIAAGPIGRQAAAATDGKLEAEIFSYSRSRGLFAGVSFDGAALLHDKDSNATFAADKRPETAKAVSSLKAKLVELSKEPPATPSQVRP